MTSKEIITRLIDEKLINGEEAYTLINDVIIAEVVESIKTLNHDSNNVPYTWHSIPYVNAGDYTTSTAITASSGSSV